MKTLLQNTATYAFSIYVTSVIFNGLKVYGGINTLVITGLLLTLIMIIIKPIVSALTIPFNILSLGLLSFLSVAASLFILGFFYHEIKVIPFDFGPYSFFSFQIAKYHLTPILSFLCISATIYVLHRAIFWIYDR